MATESVTKAVEFDHAPVYPRGLFQVNQGIGTTHAIGAEAIVSTFVRERLRDGVADGGLGSDDLWVLGLLTDMSLALRKACGVEA